jgi:DNA processing protein
MTAELSEQQAWMVLNALPHVGPISTNRLLAEFGGDPRRILAAGPRELEAVRGVGPAMVDAIRRWPEHFNLAREEAMLERLGARFVAACDQGYPPLLREIHDPPIGLYQKGPYRWDRPGIALVGSRRTTLYGQAVARRFGGELAQAGFCVVSGLARGIDTAAHEGALAAGGITAAVLGNGLDIVYPPENLDLYRKIGDTGAVVSEFPFGRRADRQSFPMRNRVVAGICHAIVVVESDVDGGSMITAKFAGEQGRAIFAVPGRIDQATSRGCHQLIRDGAVLCTSVDDIVDELRLLPLVPKGGAGGAAGAATSAPAALPALAGVEATVAACFAGGALLSADQVAEQTGLPVHEATATLMMLEIKRHLVRRLDGTYEARA